MNGPFSTTVHSGQSPRSGVLLQVGGLRGRPGFLVRVDAIEHRKVNHSSLSWGVCATEGSSPVLAACGHIIDGPNTPVVVLIPLEHDGCAAYFTEGGGDLEDLVTATADAMAVAA